MHAKEKEMHAREHAPRAEEMQACFPRGEEIHAREHAGAMCCDTGQLRDDAFL